MRKIFAAVIVGALMGAPTTAYAATSDGNYTPDDPSVPTLAGTSLTSECATNERWIDYQVRLTAPDGQNVAGDAVLALGSGARTVTVPLGSLRDGAVGGRVAWPGDPGRVGSVVDATVTVPGAAPLALPLTVPECSGVLGASVLATVLPATGLAGWVVPLAGLGALLVALGVAVGLIRRSRVP